MSSSPEQSSLLCKCCKAEWSSESCQSLTWEGHRVNAGKERVEVRDELREPGGVLLQSMHWAAVRMAGVHRHCKGLQADQTPLLRPYSALTQHTQHQAPRGLHQHSSSCGTACLCRLHAQHAQGPE